MTLDAGMCIGRHYSESNICLFTPKLAQKLRDDDDSGFGLKRTATTSPSFLILSSVYHI
jgi:hypothetical protein